MKGMEMAAVMVMAVYLYGVYAMVKEAMAPQMAAEAAVAKKQENVEPVEYMWAL